MSTPESVEKSRRAEGFVFCTKHLIDLVRAHPEKATAEAMAVLRDTAKQIRAKQNDRRPNHAS